MDKGGGSDDSKWEFQAPQFVDFNNLEAEENASADEFFNVDMESGESWNNTNAMEVEEGSQQGTMGGQEKSEMKKNDEIPKIQVDGEVTTENKESEVPATRRPANMVTSWGSGVRKVMGGGSDSAQLKTAKPRGRQETPRRAALRAAVAQSVENARNSPRRATPKRLGTNSSGPRLTPGTRARTSSNNPSTNDVARTLAKSSAAAGPPRTPEVVRRYKNKVLASTSNMAQNTTKLAVKSIPSIKPEIRRQVVPPRPTAAKPSLTKPMEFKFATGSLARTHKTVRPAVDVPNFNKMLRSYGREEQGGEKGVTQPAPFPRAERDRKRRHSADTNKFKSQAEQIVSFQKGTPDRFRSKPNQVRSRHRSASPAPSPRLTQPQTPQLATRGRARPPQVLSAAEREEEDLAKAKENQFKAHGVGATLPKFKYGEVEKKSCTVPQPFALTSSGASGRPPMPPPSEEPAAPFQAKPLPKKILSGPLGVPEKKVQPIVEPQSPAFALKARMTERKLLVPQVPIEVEPVIKVRPAPHRGVPVALPPPAKKSTMPEPFSFAERDQQAKDRKEEKIKKLIEEEKAAREFHASAVPKVVESGGRLPERQQTQPTKVAPFNLQIEERVESRLAKWQEGVAKELEEQKAAALFKATEAKVLDAAPFTIKESNKPLTEVSNIVLHSDRRAEEREQYEMTRKENEVKLLAAKREREERKKREEEEEVQRLRKAAVHKAQPIRNYKPIEVKGSDKPLTLPSSPCLQTGKANKNTTFNQ